MWTFEDVPELSVDMDGMRSYPSYETGFDACDPLGSVQWSGRGPARVLRRRCRSEGVDRSPYEDGNRELHCFVDSTRQAYRPLPNKSHFTINNGLELRLDRYHHECLLPTAENGDYVMANDNNMYPGYKQGRSKYYRASPTRPLITTLTNAKADDRLPKVEELLEKVDQEMMEVGSAKQPLKSILNNPLPKSPPQGILKKPKCKPYHECKGAIEGRRRQRASSESDNTYCNYHIAAPVPGYDRHSYQNSNMKRARDNSGGYSYNSLSPVRNSSPTKPYSNNLRCSCKDHIVINTKDEYKMHVLRTTAINNDTVNDIPVIVSPHKETRPVPRGVSPALPISSVTPAQTKPPKTKKKCKKVHIVKVKTAHQESVIEGEIDDFHSRSPSPDPDGWHMETDGADIEPDKPPPRATSPHTPSPHTPSPHALSPHTPSPHAPSPHAPSPHTLSPHAPSPQNTEHNSVTKLTSKLNGTIVSPKKSYVKDGLVLPESISNCIRPSLFPRVPPYLKFVRHDEATPLKVPAAIQKHLKWKLTTITPIVVKKTLTNSGFRLIKSECDTAECPQEETLDWIGIWGKHMKSLMFRAIKDGQKMNHFPGTFQIGRKDRLWRNLQKLSAKFGLDEFGIMPKTYVLPHDLKILKHEWEKYAANNERWIIKPPASARGTGIKVVSRWAQIPKKRPVVVQRYVSRPYLINGSKFDLRLYVLLTSVHPLRIYLYRDGLARFASVKYNDELTSLNDRYMHLTNYSINRLSKNYTPNEDFAACEGHKWTLETLFQYLKNERKVDTEALWAAITDLVVKTIISGEPSISALTRANVGSRYNCYELFGIDVLLDEDLKPWLLEVNISPSLHSASPLDVHVKGPLVAAVLNLAQFHVPARTSLDALAQHAPHKLDGLPYDSRLYTVYLSKEERDKHIIYTNMEDRDLYLRDMLSTLTPDDVRQLLVAEDELAAAGGLRRVFPTAHTHTYLRYLPGPRYYNRLLDAWETRYGHDRRPGIELLRRLCATGYHLEAPPVPLKNDVDAPTPPASQRPSVSGLASSASIPSAVAASAASVAANAAAATANAAAATANPAAATANPATAAASAPRVCGDALAHAAPQALEPRA